MKNNIYYSIFALFLFFFLRSQHENFRTRILILNKNKDVVKEYVHFQHNKLVVTKESYEYCQEYERQLLSNYKLLNKLKINS